MIEENGGGNTIGGNDTTQAVFTEVDRIVQRSPYESDRRHRVTISGVYHLPFGREPEVPAQRESGRRRASSAAGKSPECGCSTPAGRGACRQNVFYVKDATLENVDYNDANVIRAVQNCVAQMNDAGVVTMLGFSVAAGCTEPNFIIRPNYTPPDDGSSATIRSGGRRSISST